MFEKGNDSFELMISLPDTEDGECVVFSKREGRSSQWCNRRLVWYCMLLRKNRWLDIQNLWFTCIGKLAPLNKQVQVWRVRYCCMKAEAFLLLLICSCLHVDTAIITSPQKINN